MRIIYAILITILVIGCAPQTPGKYTNKQLPGMLLETCINNVTYYESNHQLAPAFRPDGTLYTC